METTHAYIGFSVQTLSVSWTDNNLSQKGVLGKFGTKPLDRLGVAELRRELKAHENLPKIRNSHLSSRL